MKNIWMPAMILCCSLFASAQTDSEDEKNVVISKAKREYKFVKGNTEHPVQVKEETDRVYTCTNYRTNISVVEFYNDEETVDDLNIYVNDSRKHGIVPKYEYYNADGVFYSDAHVCYFQLPLLKKGSTSEVIFKKTTLDPHYFTSIYFTDNQDILEQEIKIIVPS